MTTDQAKAAVLQRFPMARCIPVYSLCLNDHLHVIVDGTSYQGKWLSGKHRTEDAAWLRAAKEIRK